MPLPEIDRTKLAQRVNEALERIDGYAHPDLADIGHDQITLEPLRAVLSDVFQYKRLLDNEHTTRLPVLLLERLGSSLHATAEALGELRQFGNVGGPKSHRADQRDGLVNSFLDQQRESSSIVVQCISMAMMNQELLTEQEERFQSARSRQLKQLNKSVQAVHQLSNQVTDEGLTIGVGIYARRFDRNRKRHARMARLWLAWTLVLFALAVYMVLEFFVISSFVEPVSIQESAESAFWQVVIARLVVVSLVYSGVLWTAKNFRIHRHLQVTDEHRANALSTFERFWRRADAGDMKARILTEVAECVFGARESGYLGRESAGALNPLTNLVKSVRGT